MRLWSWEAFAHDAEVVSYFRWRQAPFAQEQMHAGLMYRDNTPAPGQEEANKVSDELKKIEIVIDTKEEEIRLLDDSSQEIDIEDIEEKVLKNEKGSN